CAPRTICDSGPGPGATLAASRLFFPLDGLIRHRSLLPDVGAGFADLVGLRVARLDHLVVLRLLDAFEREAFEPLLLVVFDVFRRLPAAVDRRVARIARQRLHADRGVLRHGRRQVAVEQLIAGLDAILRRRAVAAGDARDLAGALLDILRRDGADGLAVFLHFA